MELLKAAGFGLGAAFIVSIFAGPVEVERRQEIIICFRHKLISKVETVNVGRAVTRSIDVIRAIVFDKTGEPQIPSSGGRSAAGDHLVPAA